MVEVERRSLVAGARLSHDSDTFLVVTTPLQPDACALCERPATETGALVSGSSGAGICADCVDRARLEIDRRADEHAPSESVLLRDLYRIHFQDPRRERQFLSSVSFFVTFALVRLIVRSIQEGRGPFHNVSAGGKHIHHLVWGILLLLLVGLAWLQQVGTGVLRPRKWMRATAVLYGAGSALTLDEFALWLNLSDVYFTAEGRESIDAVILFGSVLSIGFWGQPFLHALTRHALRKAAAPLRPSGT